MEFGVSQCLREYPVPGMDSQLLTMHFNETDLENIVSFLVLSPAMRSQFAVGRHLGDPGKGKSSFTRMHLGERDGRIFK